MRLARARTALGTVVEGEYENGTIRSDRGTYEIGEEATLLAPCEPSALYCVGRNYATTLEQMAYERPAEPDFFVKPPTSVVGPDEPIPYPNFSDEVTYAGELAAVVGERTRDVEPAAVPDVVAGYTIVNDVDALDQPGRTARKAFDGSAPIGPWIETDVDPTGIELRTTVGGELRQEANTDAMLFDPYEIVSFLSARLTLEPGDVVAFGSPANPGLIEPGDEVAITYEGIGTLSNVVEAV